MIHDKYAVMLQFMDDMMSIVDDVYRSAGLYSETETYLTAIL